MPPLLKSHDCGAVRGWKIAITGENEKPTGYVILLALWKTRASLQTHRRTFVRGKPDRQTLAFFEPEHEKILSGDPKRRRWRRNRFLGTIHLNCEDLETGVVVHEAQHAILEYGRRTGILKLVAEGRCEEPLSYGIQWLVDDINARLREA
jgi:hypothetical protein